MDLRCRLCGTEHYGPCRPDQELEDRIVARVLLGLRRKRKQRDRARHAEYMRAWRAKRREAGNADGE